MNFIKSFQNLKELRNTCNFVNVMTAFRPSCISLNTCTCIWQVYEHIQAIYMKYTNSKLEMIKFFKRMEIQSQLLEHFRNIYSCFNCNFVQKNVTFWLWTGLLSLLFFLLWGVLVFYYESDHAVAKLYMQTNLIHGIYVCVVTCALSS